LCKKRLAILQGCVLADEDITEHMSNKHRPILMERWVSSAGVIPVSSWEAGASMLNIQGINDLVVLEAMACREALAQDLQLHCITVATDGTAVCRELQYGTQ
jgi:hypothetical protein